MGSEGRVEKCERKRVQNLRVHEAGVRTVGQAAREKKGGGSYSFLVEFDAYLGLVK